MSDHQHRIWQLADAIQMDLRAAQAKMTEMRSYLANLDLPNRDSYTFMNGPVTAPCCDECGCGGEAHTVDCSLKERKAA